MTVIYRHGAYICKKCKTSFWTYGAATRCKHIKPVILEENYDEEQYDDEDDDEE